MITSIENQVNILQLPEEDGILLKKVTKGQAYVYNIRYLANAANLFKTSNNNKAYQVLIRIYKNKPKKNDIQLFEEGSLPGQVIDKLLKGKSLKRAIKGLKEKDLLLSLVSDITKKIPNDLLGEITKADFNPSASDIAINKKLIIRTLSVEEIEDAGLVAPVLETNLNKPLAEDEQELEPDDEEIQKESLNLLFVNNLDPAEFVGAKSNALVSAKKQYAGVITRPHRLLLSDQKDKNKTDVLIKPLLNKIIAANHLELDGVKSINVPVKESQIYVEIKERITIPTELLKETTFIVQLDLITKKGKSRQRITRVVNHAELAAIFLNPVVEPAVSGYALSGKNLLRITQLDKHATRVDVYKKTLSTDRFVLDSPYEKLESLDIKNRDGEFTLEDAGVGTSPVIYRAIPVAADGIPGGIFSGVVVPGKRNRTSLRETFIRRPSFLTLSHEIQENTVVLFIDNIAPGPIAVELYRRDLSFKQANFQKIGGTILLVDTKNRPIQITDSKIKPDRIYEYRCELLYADGTKIKAGNNIFTEFEPVTANVVELKINNFQIVQNREDIDVTFDIEKNVILNNMDTVKTFLAEQGITEYDTDIEENREKLQDLFFVRALRFNLSSGEIEDFGVLNTTVFSDRSIGAVRGVSELKAGLSYKYVLVAYARPAETLLPTLRRTVQTGTNSSYELNPSKYLHPITLKNGSLVTPSSLTRNHANSPFTLGKVVDRRYLSANLGKTVPSVQQVIAARINEKMVLVRWRTIGDSARLDHFLVTLEIGGMRTIVGKAHAISDTNEFKFIDTLDNGEHGALEYIITPVFFNFSRGIEERSNQIIIEA